MSRKWTNPHLVLRPATASSSEDNQDNQVQHDPISNVTILPESVDSSFLSRRDSTFSDAQYAIAAPANQYLDLPSAIPFQDFVSPALPSAEFPSSAKGFVSPPGTSSTTNFPDPSSHQAVAATRTISPGNGHQSNPAIPSDHATPSASTQSHPIIATPTAGATALSRADSSVSYDSIWSGEGSQRHIALDINQFPRPPETASDEPSSARSSPSTPSFNLARKAARLKPPASPLYEESEPSASRPLTPIVGEVSYQYPISTSIQQQSSTSLEQTQDAQDVDSLVIQYLRPQSDGGNGLILPSLAPTSARASYQSHMTAASRGSSSPRMSIGDAPARASVGPESSAAWDEVMNTVKPLWYSSGVMSRETSVQRSPVMSTISHAAVGTSTAGHDDGFTLNAPPVPANNLLSPFSGDESNSDVYSAIGRMNFPKPPILHASHDAEASPPISPGPPRSPWVTGLKLKTTSNRSSLATLKRRIEDSPITSHLAHTVPPLPLSARDIAAPTSAALSPPLIMSSPAEEYADAAYSSSGKESNRDSQRLGVPTESRNSAQSVEAPSYNRRVSDLLRAAAEPPLISPRDSVTSTGITTSDSRRSSVDGAIVGVARAASLSVRTRALLTQPPMIGTDIQETSLPYIVPSPSTSVGPSEASLLLAPSIVTRVAPRNSPESDDQDDASSEPKNSIPRPMSLPRPPPIQALGAFPESVGSGTSLDNPGYEISLSRFQSRDMPHSAVPLNQSTPFENHFPHQRAPSAYRHPGRGDAFNETESPTPALSHSQSKSKSYRSSVLSRASSRAAKAMSWFRKKPLPSLPPSPTHDKKEKGLPNPDDNMSVPDLRAATMDHYLEVGELPYNSPTASPLPQGQEFARRGSHPRQSIASVLSSMSDRARGERRTRSVGFSQIPEAKLESNQPASVGFCSTKSRKIICFALIFCILAAAIPIGVVYGRRVLSNNVAVSNCPDGLAGASCQLNSTCVCTSSTTGRCDPVAKSLVDLVPTVNTVFGMNLTTNSLALQLWDLQGQPAADCASQAILVDVSPALNQTTLSKRTEWTRAAILYTLLRTYDLAATETFRSSVSRANVGSLQDAPVTDSPAGLKFIASGFEFDIAAMTCSAAAVSWINNSGADATQVERVGVVAGQALDRMYSFAFASSTQRCTALRYYWTKDLQLSEDLLGKFEASFSTAPILLPFDAASSTVASFLANVTENDGSSFPAPLACYPDLSDQARTNVRTIEQHAFDLGTLGAVPSTLDSACFPDRPTYGVLDVLRLRRPFGDARESMRVTTAQLIPQAGSRAILHGGEQLVGLTGFRDDGPATRATMTTTDADPRCYGTLDNLDHIALSYLLAFPSVDLAKKAAQFIANANDETAPPTSGDALLDGTTLDNIPTIEVAVFGSILPADVKIFHADLATPKGTLFFGSKNGDIFRKWVLRYSDDQIRWSNSSTSPQVVHESTANNVAFETVWSQAADLINQAAEVGRGTGLPEVNRIMDSLRNASLLT